MTIIFPKIVSRISCVSKFFYLFLCCSITSGQLFALCDCPDPLTCPPQLNAPPYQPCTFITSANSYSLRYSAIGVPGAMTFIGNTLGLSKEPCLNEPGTPGTVIDSIGAFTTIDPTQSVNSYVSLFSGPGSPAGTTLDWRLNASSAQLNIPAGAIILHAELIWSGSFGFFCGDPLSGPGMGVDPNCVLDFASGPISFTTPDGVTHLITADPTTAMESQNPAPDVQNFYCGGNYTRSQDVTAIMVLLANMNGTYTVGGVPATVSAFDNSHNAAGWTLALIYEDPSSSSLNNMALFLGAQQGSRASVSVPASMIGFCAQTTPGLQSARILVSAIEGDADNMGDQLQFGPSPTTLTPLSGPNNLVSNFFASQINDDNGNLITDTGTYCIFNQDPASGVLVPNGRQGYDITNIDCSSFITPGQTEAYALGTTTGDDYTINALGIQISVVAPTILPIKKVNSAFTVEATIGDTINFAVEMENTGLSDALNVVFQDSLESGLLFIPGSVTLNGVPMPSANPMAGIALGTIPIGEMDTIEFDVRIVSGPPTDVFFVNQGSASFTYSACVASIDTLNYSNVAVITLTSDPPGPTDFLGSIKKCQFLNETEYSLKATWTPLDLPLFSPYEIFRNGILEATIGADGPYVFETCLNSIGDASEYTIIADYAPGITSDSLNIRIVNE